MVKSFVISFLCMKFFFKSRFIRKNRFKHIIKCLPPRIKWNCLIFFMVDLIRIVNWWMIVVIASYYLILVTPESLSVLFVLIYFWFLLLNPLNLFLLFWWLLLFLKSITITKRYSHFILLIVFRQFCYHICFFFIQTL